MAILNVMSGVPGCGKSTYITLHKGPVDAVISRDVIRAQIASKYNPDDPYFMHEQEVYREFTRQINEAGLVYDTVWADATHLNHKSLNKLFYNINTKEFSEIHIICIEASLEKCLAQNALRTGKARVPEDSIKSMYASYRRPSADDYPDLNVIVEVVHG